MAQFDSITDQHTTNSPSARGAQPLQPELEWRVRGILEDLSETEAECEALWDENEQLKAERMNLLAAFAQAQKEVERTRHHIQTIEATRGWRLLSVLRRCRDFISGRRARHRHLTVQELTAAFSAMDAKQQAEFYNQVGM